MKKTTLTLITAAALAFAMPLYASQDKNLLKEGKVDTQSYDSGELVAPELGKGNQGDTNRTQNMDQDQDKNLLKKGKVDTQGYSSGELVAPEMGKGNQDDTIRTQNMDQDKDQNPLTLKEGKVDTQSYDSGELNTKD